MKVAVVKETFPGERRVALVPAVLKQLNRAGIEVVVEAGAGQSAGYEDREYEENGARIVGSRQEAFRADIVSQVRCLGANPEAGRADLDLLRKGQILLGSCDPLGNPQAIQQLADRGVTLLALEMIPRITRAQSMDVLSSMATIAGYRAVLLGAVELPKMFPLMMTAAGTVSPARVFVIGAGVAGLQAIATSRRLGAVVHAYDVRPAVREQVESLGGKFVELQLEADESEDKGGYAKAMGEAFYQKQREFMAEVAAESDVVIATAAIPGKPSPLLITESAVQQMSPGSVIIDLAAERGGNCELAQPDQRVEKYGVTILGPTNLPSEIPYHASQMYSKNVATLLSHLVNDGQLQLDMADEISRDTTVAHQGDVCNHRIREMLGLEPLREVAEEKESAGQHT
ncbi:MAG: NAD(P)(+) transhydrogenase (Re/Si-specific) subunit alpha [Planctomycetaceae bacterium]|nr:NAD(P)(+) transhydrogenase (Re/Si-specific) subunit alpha [Planctomycetaceae bacterium]MBP63051.1 NAD(P)(+) transhydrogenase (Re/Si-specific) subunit alpha [Planctomycetaceae bacterium]